MRILTLKKFISRITICSLLLCLLPIYSSCGTTSEPLKEPESAVLSLYDEQERITSETATPDNISEGYLPDGVYSFINKSSNTKLCVKDEGYVEGSPINCALSEEHDNSLFDRQSLFKISRIGKSDEYTIRAMTNNCLTIGNSGKVAITKKVSPDDTNVSSDQTFRIKFRNDGYSIYRSNENDMLSVEISSDGNAYLTFKKSFLSQEKNSLWFLEPYTGMHAYGIELYTPQEYTKTGITCKSKIPISIVCWSTYANANQIYSEEITEYTHIAKLELNSDGFSYDFSALKIGKFQITLGIKHLTGNNFLPLTFEFFITPAAGNYFLQNVSTEKYLSHNTSDSKSESSVILSNYNNGAGQQWSIERVSYNSPYVTLKSVDSNRYLSADLQKPSNIVLSDTADDNALWSFETTAVGNLKIINKTSPSDEYSLSATNGSSAKHDLTYAESIDEAKNTGINSYSYNNNDYYDEWYAVKKVLSAVNYYGDSYFSELDNVSEIIQSAISFTNLVYARYFNLGICMIDEPINLPADIQRGSRSASYFSDLLFYGDRHDDHVYILWTPDNPGWFVRYENGVQTELSSLGLVINDSADDGAPVKRPVIHILSFSSKSNSNVAADRWHGVEAIRGASIVLAHEFTHVLQMNDIYDSGDIHQSVKEFTCIMGKFNTSFMERLYIRVQKGQWEPFCDECKTTLERLTGNASIKGNIE